MLKKIIHFSMVAFLLACWLVSPTLAAPQTNILTTASTDTLVEANSGQPATLDPALDYEAFGQEVIRQVYDTLLSYNREKMDEFVPQLATDWTISSDAKTYTFSIRKGVRFHNGDTLTPADVAFSFQRGLLQGGSKSPQWLFYEPLIGETQYFDVSSLVDPSGALLDNRDALKAADSSKLQAACQQVQNAITFDNTAWTVTFHLHQAWSPFLVSLVGTWGSVMDRSWVNTHGGWDGSCATWQNYYAPTTAESLSTQVGSRENGTGPFMLNDWTPSEITLIRNPYYWRTAPAWTGGPSGLAELNWVKIENVSDSATRATMLLDGDADLGTFSATDYPTLDAALMMRYIQGQPDPILVNPTGVLNRYENVESTTVVDGFFNYDIHTNSSYNMIGSGLLDGNGIPANFFTDIHVRKAFNYAFDWNTYIQDAFGGKAVQRRGPIIAGLPGYTDTQPIYSHDTTQAMNELTLAWNGQVVDKGFIFTISYPIGDLARQTFCEILKANIEALNPKYHINILPLAKPNFNSVRQLIPLFPGGWMQDIPDPFDWVFGFINYGGLQSMPDDLLSQFTPKVADCVQRVGADAAQCYAVLQNMAYDQAIDIFLAQGFVQNYVRNDVQGYYINPDFNFEPYFYALSKSSPPVTDQITQNAAKTVSFTEPTGAADTVVIPSGSFNEPANIVVLPGGISAGQTSGFRLGDQGFDISTFQADGSMLHPSFDPSQPVLVTVHYDLASMNGILENTFKLYYLNPQTGNWEDAACGATQLDKTNKTITVPICHFSRFALGGVGYYVYLPTINK
jgi:peptide/nickel transport system substrate-binding protein